MRGGMVFIQAQDKALSQKEKVKLEEIALKTKDFIFVYIFA